MEWFIMYVRYQQGRYARSKHKYNMILIYLKKKNILKKLIWIYLYESDIKMHAKQS